jgi:peroxiredoxin
MPIKVGEQAPGFTLSDQNGKEINLAALRGKRVLLSFHPLAWTGVCAKQMKALDDNFKRFEKLNAVPLGVSIDSVPTKEAWANELGLEKLSLLSDFNPIGAMARSYGLFREEDGFTERANVIIDELGKVVFVKVYDLPELPDLDEIFRFIEGM